MSGTPQQPSPEPGSTADGQFAAAPAPRRDHLPAIPGCEVLGRLGAGGMGIVYQARHLALNRLVAIKVLNRIQQASEREILRLQMEGETVANLQHPNIVPLYQMGEFAGLPFLTFEYIDGGTLADRIAGRPQPPREAAEMVELLARAVQLAHQQGVLHRDLKPANVLLSKDGVPKIADFGLARRLDNDQFSTELIAGTANYMSPEQAWGDSKTNPLTPATDVYSLGAILYELLTGRPPFASDSREQTIKDVWNKAPAEPRSLSPDVPLDLQTICLKCLEKEPGRRYSSALELADDLRRWLNSEPIIARPTGRFERTLLWCRRDPFFAGVCAALVVAVLSGTTATSWLAMSYRDKSVAEQKAASRADLSATLARDAEAVAVQGQKQLAVANDQLASKNHELERRLYETSIIATARDVELMNQDPQGTPRAHLADHLRQCSRGLRDLEWHIRNRQMQGSLLTRPVTRHNLVALAVSPDGKWVATGAINLEDYAQGEPVRIWSTEDWQLRTSLGRHGQRLTFSPDSQLLVIDNPSTGVEIWNWREGRVLRTFSRKSTPLKTDEYRTPIFQPVEGAAAFSPDGRHFAIGLANTVQIYPLQPGSLAESTVERTLKTGAVIALHYCPDGQHLVVLAYVNRSKDSPHSWMSELQVWNAATGGLIHKLPLESTFKLLAVSPDGRQCAAASVRTEANRGPFELCLYELGEGRDRKFTLRADPETIRFGRDGQTLLIGNQNGDVDVLDSKGLKVTSTLVGHLGTGIVGVDSLSDGRIISAGSDGDLKVWPRDGQSRLPHFYDGSLPYALSQDGRELAVAQADGSVRRFVLNDNRELPRLPAQGFKEPAGKPFDGSRLPKELRIGGLCYPTTPGQLLVAYSNLSVRTWRLDDTRVIASIDLVGPAVTRPDPSSAHASGFFVADSHVPRIVFSGDGKYAAWQGYAPDTSVHRPIGQPATTLLAWEVSSGRRIVNQYQRLSLGPDFSHKNLNFETIDGRPWLVVSERMATVVVPGRPYDSGDLSSGWDLTTGAKRSDRAWEDEHRQARGSRSFDAYKVLRITESATGLTLLEIPLGATATELPQLNTDRSRLAVATDRGIAVFDVGPLPEFSLPNDRADSSKN
jgi:serine/threonine protein kinase/WD40 repeat protein